jgi:CxxC motif-containing protein
MTVETNGNAFIVHGHKCPRGEAFAITEMTNPMRTLCTTIRINNADSPVIAVKTSVPIPKKRLMDVMHVLNALTVSAPLTCGDIVLHDVLGLGADIVATANGS